MVVNGLQCSIAQFDLIAVPTTQLEAAHLLFPGVNTIHLETSFLDIKINTETHRHLVISSVLCHTLNKKKSQTCYTGNSLALCYTRSRTLVLLIALPPFLQGSSAKGGSEHFPDGDKDTEGNEQLNPPREVFFLIRHCTVFTPFNVITRAY